MGHPGRVMEFLEREHGAAGDVEGLAATELCVEVEDNEVAAQRLCANDPGELLRGDRCVAHVREGGWRWIGEAKPHVVSVAREAEGGEENDAGGHEGDGAGEDP